MSDQPAPVRSYQRIFRPDRRIFAVDGRTLPVPGGVPLRWLGTAIGALVIVIALTSQSRVAWLVAGGSAAWAAVVLSRRRWVPASFATAVLVCVGAGALLRALEWPLRLIVLPAVVATIAVQVTPDGRPAHRYVWSWLRVRLAGRRSVGRPCESRRVRPVSVHVAHDERAAALRRAQIQGPATVTFRQPVVVARRGRRRVVRGLDGRRRRGGMLLDGVTAGERERVVIRP